MYVKERGVSTDDLKVSKDSNSTFTSLEEQTRLGGDDGGVSRAGSPICAKPLIVGVLGDAGELVVLIDIEGRVVLTLSGSGTGRAKPFLSISLLVRVVVTFVGRLVVYVLPSRRALLPVNSLLTGSLCLSSSLLAC